MKFKTLLISLVLMCSALTMMGQRCVTFDSLNIGDRFGDPIHTTGEWVFNQEGIDVYVEWFEWFSGGTFNFCEVQGPMMGFGQGFIMGMNNICLRFDMTNLPFIPGKVTLDYLDMGGFENFSANGHPVYVGEITTIPNFPGATTFVTSTPLSGGFTGTVEATGQVTEIWIGGQEFWIDNICTHDLIGVNDPVVIEINNILGQNYPNPLVGSTTIPFYLNSAAHISLKVYDIFGKEVATLIDSEYTQGAHKISWDGSGVPNGIYFYKLEAGSDVRVCRMNVVR